MVKFVDVDVKDIPFRRQGRRGRISYPILKSFLETGKHCVMLDRTGVQQSFQALYSVLRAYIINHELPIKIFSSGGELYLMRVDMDEEGNPIEDWTPQGAQQRGPDIEDTIRPINDEEVDRRAEVEKNKTTK